MVDVIVYKRSPYGLLFIHDKRPRRVRPFFKVFWYNPEQIAHSESSTTIPSFFKLDNVYLCLWAIFYTYISHVIVTKTMGGATFFVFFI